MLRIGLFPENHPKIGFWMPPGRLSVVLGRLLAPLGRLRGASWTLLGRPWAPQDASGLARALPCSILESFGWILDGFGEEFGDDFW